MSSGSVWIRIRKREGRIAHHSGQEIGSCVPLYAGVRLALKVRRSTARKPEQMNSTTYWWQGAYECAVLETNPARMATLIDDALYAIEQRSRSTGRLDQVENEAIEVALKGLAVIRGEWFGGLAESMRD